MKWDRKRKFLDLDAEGVAVPNFRRFLRKVADTIKNANAGESTLEQLRGVDEVCI